MKCDQQMFNLIAQSLQQENYGHNVRVTPGGRMNLNGTELPVNMGGLRAMELTSGRAFNADCKYLSQYPLEVVAVKLHPGKENEAWDIVAMQHPCAGYLYNPVSKQAKDVLTKK